MGQARDWRGFRDRWIELLERQTGHDLAHWTARIDKAAPRDRDALRGWLTAEGVSGYPRMLLIQERFGYPQFMTATADELVDAQYADRPGLRPVYEAIVGAALDLGEVVVQARKTYVSLVGPRRTFARIQPTTRTRLDLGLRLESRGPGGRLKPGRIHETMPVQVGLERVADFDEEALGWLAEAYAENA